MKNLAKKKRLEEILCQDYLKIVIVSSFMVQRSLQMYNKCENFFEPKKTIENATAYNEYSRKFHTIKKCMLGEITVDSKKVWKDLRQITAYVLGKENPGKY